MKPYSNLEEICPKKHRFAACDFMRNHGNNIGGFTALQALDPPVCKAIRT